MLIEITSGPKCRGELYWSHRGNERLVSIGFGKKPPQLSRAPSPFLDIALPKMAEWEIDDERRKTLPPGLDAEQCIVVVEPAKFRLECNIEGPMDDKDMSIQVHCGERPPEWIEDSMDINHVPYDFEVGKSNARRAKNAPLHASLFDDRDLLDQSLEEVLSEKNVRMHDD